MSDCEDQVARQMAQQAIDENKAHGSICARMWTLAMFVMAALLSGTGYLISRAP